MKNYLFAPFRDDDDKIREFNAMFKALMHLVDAEHELHVIRVFVCRLESYHDATIEDMHNNKAEIVDGLLEESNLLKAENVELQAEIRVYIELRDKRVHKIKELQAEIRQLKADAKHDAKVCEDYDDGLRDEIKSLQAVNNRLMEQVSSNRGNSSSTHTHTISGEIRDYMNHNDKCKEVRLYILPMESFKDGLYDGDYICYDDGIEV